MVEKIVFLDKSTFPGHIVFSSPGIEHEWTDFQQTSPEQVVERAKSASIIVSNKVVINAQMIDKLPKLKHIAVIATGYNNVDVEACKAKGISVSNIQSYALKSVPEHAMAMIFALRRHLFAYRDAINNGEWQKSSQFCYYHGQTLELSGSRLGIVGGGELGKALAAMAKTFGMKVSFSDRKGVLPSGREGYLSFDQIIEESDIISLHCPLTTDTENLITGKELRAMKSNALLINMARGGVVNEDDLVSAIEQDWIAGAGSDVATTEPINDDNPLLKLVDKPNFILTPHIAWTSNVALQTQANQLIEIIEAFASGQYINRVV